MKNGTRNVIGQKLTDEIPPTQGLTAMQETLIENLFIHRDLEKMTAEEATNIFKKLDEAGIGGPGVRAAIIEVGMDPKKFRATAAEESELLHSHFFTSLNIPPYPQQSRKFNLILEDKHGC